MYISIFMGKFSSHFLDFKSGILGTCFDFSFVAVALLEEVRSLPPSAAVPRHRDGPRPAVASSQQGLRELGTSEKTRAAHGAAGEGGQGGGEGVIPIPSPLSLPFLFATPLPPVNHRWGEAREIREAFPAFLRRNDGWGWGRRCHLFCFPVSGEVEA